MVDKIKSSKLIEYGDKIVIGVSGGPDSICLFDALLKLKDELNLSLYVVHINHCIREEANIEEAYVTELCEKLKIPFFSKKVDVTNLAKEEKKTVEEMARNVRYETFNEVLRKVGANKIAVAHNANDLAETVIMNLIRGSGIKGLCGIQKSSGYIIRPLLNVTREEILEYVKENNLTVFYDSTNFEIEYTRNRIRNIIIPEILKINPNFIDTVLRGTEILDGERKILNSYIEDIYKEVSINTKTLNKTKFLKLSKECQFEVLRRAIYEFNGSLKDIGVKNLNNAINIIENAQSGSIIEILPNIKIEISYETLKFFSEKEKITFCYEIKINGETYIPELGKKIITKVVKSEEVPNKYENKNKCFFDIEKIGEKLYVRNKREGDFFYPTKMTGKKTLKKFFSDLKIDLNEREKIPIVSTDEEVIWVVGFRSSRKFLKDKSTKEVIIFEYGENI